MNKVIYLNGEPYSALYVNGVKVLESNWMEPDDVLDAVASVGPFTYTTVNEWDFDDGLGGGAYPNTLEELEALAGGSLE